LVPSADQLARRRALERVWIILGFLWVIGRVIVAKATVEQYGVSITMFAALEVLVAWPHSLSAARLVTKLIDHDPTGALPWGALLAVTHIAPELYVAVAGTNMSPGVYVSLIVIVVGLGALAIVGIIQKVAVGRSQSGAVVNVEVSASTDDNSAPTDDNSASTDDNCMTQPGEVERALAALIDAGGGTDACQAKGRSDVLSLPVGDVLHDAPASIS
jgi:hypothetical protein